MFPLKVRGEFYREETRVMVLLSGEDRMLVANYPCQRVTDTCTDGQKNFQTLREFLVADIFISTIQ